MQTSPSSRHAALAAAILLGASHAVAAQDDLTVPPRITDTPPAETRLTLPNHADQEEAMEEVIVVRENPWRLPDLGSEWRARAAAVPDTSRISADFLPLYDPEAPQPLIRDFFPVNTEMQRVGFIELIRLRFGER